jgi:hypothetical protein
MGKVMDYFGSSWTILCVSIFAFVLSGILFFYQSSEARKACTEKLKSEFRSVDDEHGTHHVDHEQLPEIFNNRKADYQKAGDHLISNHQFMAVFLVLSLMVLIYRPKDIRVPLVGIDVPESLVYIFILFGTIYLWSSFTLLLISTIDSRLALEHLADVMEWKMGGINYYYSSSRTLLDQGFIDAWTTNYFDIFRNSPSHDFEAHSGSARFMLFGVYAPLYGTALAATLAVSLRAIREKRTILTLLAFVFNAFSLGAVSVKILSRINYAHDFFAWIWFYCGAALILWLFFGQKMVDRVKETSQD